MNTPKLEHAAPFSNNSTQVEKAMESVFRRISAMPRRSNEDYDKQRYSEIMDMAGVPYRHRKTKPVEDEEWGECLKALKSKLTRGYTVILCGERGTGKTQVAVQAIKDAASRGFVSRFDSFYRFCQRLKETFDKRGANESEVIAEYVKPRLLVLDEVGKATSTEWSQSALFNLIDRRYNAMKDTILITNHTLHELPEAIGASIVRRASETGGSIDTTPWKKRHLT